MQISLISWESHGMRCPDNKVNFVEKKKLAGVNLVQMPNGTGKSTIIELVKIVMCGPQYSSQFSTSEVREFRSHDDDAPDKAFFQVELSVPIEHKQKKLVLRMDIDFTKTFPEIEFKTLRDKGAGLEDDWLPPTEIKPFLLKECINVFLFDNQEYNKTLLNNNSTTAEDSICAFFGLTAMEQLYHKIESKKIIARNQARTGTVQEKNKKLKVYHQWSEHLKNLRDKEKKLKKTLDKFNIEFAELEKKVIHERKILNPQNVEKDKLQANLKDSENSLIEVANESMEYLRNPHLISNDIRNSLKELYSNFDDCNLPGSAKAFFNELINKSECICDRPMSEDAKKAIEKNTSEYLDDGQVNLINRMKLLIHEETEINMKKNILDKLETANKNFAEANKEWDFFQTQEKESVLTREENDKYDDLKIQRSSLEKELAQFQETIHDKKPQRHDPYRYKSIPFVDRQRAKFEKEAAKANESIKTRYALQKLQDALQEIKSKTLKELKEEIRIKANEKLQVMLDDNFHIVEIDKNIVVGSNNPASIQPKQQKGSGGQDIALSFSFVASILERAGMQFPLIVDHPVTDLSYETREGLAKSLPKISHQFLGFIVNSEKPHFYKPLKESANKKNLNCSYYTIFNKSGRNKKYADKLPKDNKKYTETRNGWVCSCEKFFSDFNLNTEESI